jgi:hypothetical protein
MSACATAYLDTLSGGRLHIETDMFYVAGLVEADQALRERFDLVF